MTRRAILFFFIFIILHITVLPQIKVTALQANRCPSDEKFLFGKSNTRYVELINDNWKTYPADNPQNKVNISLPSVFEEEEILVFEREFELTQQQIDNNLIKVGFLGLNYSSEIAINNNIIVSHHSSAYPFEISLPNDLLHSDRRNVLSVKLNSKLDSENTYPVRQRFLFPEYLGGIIRDVYIKILPQLSISKIDFNLSLNSSLSAGKINFDIEVENTTTKPKFNEQTQFAVQVNLYPQSAVASSTRAEFNQTIYNEEKYEAHCPVEVSNPILWSTNSPNIYTCEIVLIKDGKIIDTESRQLAFYNLSSKDSRFTLNGNSFTFYGTTYLLNETISRQKNLYEKIKEDLLLIKQTGFNSVRFAKSNPHPYALQMCMEIGLIPLIELPINSIPENFFEQEDYKLKSIGFFKEYLSSYYDYSNFLIVGVGGSYLPNSEITSKFINRLGSEVKKRNLLSYASFCGVQSKPIENIDLIGLEVFSVPKDLLAEKLSPALSEIGSSHYFLSEVSYPNYKGHSAGYLVRNSIEAQAKYLNDIFTLTSQLKISGLFINSLFSYKGEFPSLFSGYSGDAQYKLSILGPNRNTNSIAYKLLYSKLNNDSKVTIPIGSRKDDNPIVFILVALFLSVLMAVLINTKRKFREDATRALIRSYNFFADIRDHRIISGIHTLILMLVISGASSLLMTILLFYLRNDILLEKLLLAFASRKLMSAVSYLAWNPQISLIIFFIVSIVKIALLSILIKIASFFIKTRISISSIYFMVVWAFLPFTLLLPIELVLFKVLVMETFGSLISIVILLFIGWMFLRLLKGIHVIFDVPKVMVYLYTFSILIIYFGVTLVKYQLTHSIIYYITNAFKQSSAMI